MAASRSPERARVGEVVRKRRRELGVSQEEMARRVGLSYAGYRPWERGERDLKSEDLPVWAEALEISRVELASRLGLGPASITSIHAAEVSDLLEQVDDPQRQEELMQAIRMIARIVVRQPPERRGT